ncbi:MAG: ATP-binding protein, partial [Acidobacteriota bacterium]
MSTADATGTMGAPGATESATPLAAEWRRLELLAHLLAEERQGREVEDSAVDRLRELQRQVEETRRNGGWRELGDMALSALECDVLACVVAPEAEPRFGWIFQSLQPGTPQPYPTPALIQELLALDAGNARHLAAVLGEGETLRRQGLVQADGDDPYQPLRPGPGITARLLGRPRPETAPPGATRVTLSPGWNDLVLPREQVAMLQEFLLWVTHRDRVFGDWGGRDCGGPVALFSGPSGTGKTFAAAVLAADLEWPLYRVDLGTLVSKYIGETEKNLNRLFDVAHGRPMVLQFDEADSLFSKRGEVREARDRYANMEVSHLLARIES